ncbi:MAG: YbaB/EbfC family nucleoid-associated protein [Elusimicrobiota bacterium]
MFDKMKELWELKKKAEEIKKELENIEFSSEDDFSCVTVKGTLEVKSITIKNLDNREKLERSILENTNKAMRNAQIESAKKTFGQM